MIEQIISFIEKVLIPYGPWGVFLASFMEEVIAPIPSSIILLAAGFIFLGDLDFSLVFLKNLFLIIVIPASIGMVLGSLFLYGIGFISGRPAIVRFGKYFGLSWEDVERAEEKFNNSKIDEISLYLLRALPVVPNTAVSALCGLVRYPIYKYIVYSFLGLATRALVLSIIGAEVGGLYNDYSQYFEVIEKYVLATLALVAMVFIFILFRRKKRKNFSKQI